MTVTKINCVSDTCCAHPQGLTAGGEFKLPDHLQNGPEGSVKWGLVGRPGLDASTIDAKTDEKNKTVTLTGTVKSEAQRRSVPLVAGAKGYKVVNQLKIVE